MYYDRLLPSYIGLGIHIVESVCAPRDPRPLAQHLNLLLSTNPDLGVPQATYNLLRPYAVNLLEPNKADRASARRNHDSDDGYRPHWAMHQSLGPGVTQHPSRSGGNRHREHAQPIP